VKLFKGVLVGFAVDAAVIETVCFVLLIFSAHYFDGRCLGLSEVSKPCSFTHYFAQTGGFLLLGLIDTGWWRPPLVGFLVLPVLALIIAYLIHRRDPGRA
jgi:hypothetical protein